MAIFNIDSRTSINHLFVVVVAAAVRFTKKIYKYCWKIILFDMCPHEFHLKTIQTGTIKKIHFHFFSNVKLYWLEDIIVCQQLSYSIVECPHPTLTLFSSHFLDRHDIFHDRNAYV